MTDAASDVQYRDSQSYETSELRDKPVEDLSKMESRARIARVAALNHNARAAFDKREMNSLHRYLSGEFHTRPARLRTQDGPTAFEVKQSVAKLVGNKTFPERARWYERTDREGKLAAMQLSSRGLRRLCAVIEELNYGDRDWDEEYDREEAVELGAVCGGNTLNDHGDDAERLYRAALRADTQHDFGPQNINEMFQFEKDGDDE